MTLVIIRAKSDIQYHYLLFRNLIRFIPEEQYHN